MKKILLFSLIIFNTSQVVQAQYFAEEYWHVGRVISNDGDTLSGEINYNLATNMIQVNNGEITQTFTARKVLYFDFLDVELGRQREFYNIPYADKNPNYEVPTFFELLHQGSPFSLLCRETLKSETVSTINMNVPTPVMTRRYVAYDYFLLKIEQKSGNVKAKISSFSKEGKLLELLSDWDEAIESYIDENKLDLDNKYEVVDIITYYNSLKQ